MTDLTKIIISAKDEASKVFGSVQGAAEKLHGSYARLAGLMSTALGVGSFAVLMKGAIDAGDEINKLSQKTGIAVGDLSALKYAADLSGVSSEALGKGIKTLNQRLVEAHDATSKQAQLFRMLGVDTTQGPNKALEQLAGAFSNLRDGEVKATLATELFGKAGVGLIPLLNQGEAGLKKLKEEAEHLGLVFSKDTAKAAEQFNDNMRSVRAAAEGAARVMLNQLAPAIVRISQAMKDAAADSGVLYAAWVGLGGVAAEALGLNDDQIVKRVKEINSELARLNAEIRGAEGAGLIVQQELIEQRKPRIAQLERELALLQRQSMVFSGSGGAGAAGANPAINEGALRTLLSSNNPQGPSWAEREIANATKALVVARAELANGSDRLTTSEKKLLEVMQSPEWATASKREKDSIKSKYEVAAALERQAVSAAFNLKQNELAADAAEKHGKALEEMSNSLDEEAERYEVEASLIGKTNVEREKAILLLRKQADLMAAGDNLQAVRDIEAAYARMFAAIDNKEAMTRQLDFWTQIGDVAGNFFADLVLHGKSAFDNLRKWVKQLLADMIALFAKRWVLQMAGVAGGASVGGDSIAGGLINAGTSAVGTWAGGALGIGGLWGVGGLTAGAAGTAGIGVGASGTAALYGAGAVEAGAATGGIAAEGFLTALGATGWGLIIVAAIAVVAAIVSRNAGGPKVGGSFFSGGAVPGTDNGRFFTPNQGDSVVRQMVEATSLGYQDAISRLGGTAGSFNFGLGFDHDPHGSARSRVSSLLTDSAGRRIYGATDRQMDDKEVPGALGLEMKRMLVAALQNSDLHDALNALFDTIDVSAATSEQLDILLARAVEMKQIIDTLSLWDVGLTVESIQMMVRGTETLGQTFNSVAASMSTFRQNFYTAEENQAHGLEIMRRQFEAMGLTLPSTRDAFRALVEGLDLSTESGSRLFRWLIDISGAFADLVPAIEGVDTAVADVVTTTTQVVQELREAGRALSDDFLTQWTAGGGVRHSIGDYLNNSLTSGLSPLDPRGRLSQAEKTFYDLLGKANAGDLDAGGKLQGARETYLQLAQAVYGSSSPFVGIFNKTFDELAKFADVATINERQAATLDKSYSVQMDMKALLIQIRDGVYITGKANVQATEENTGAINRSPVDVEPASR